eukprot:30987-Pelagococcus_subviridis.AAC.1
MYSCEFLPSCVTFPGGSSGESFATPACKNPRCVNQSAVRVVSKNIFSTPASRATLSRYSNSLSPRPSFRYPGRTANDATSAMTCAPVPVDVSSSPASPASPAPSPSPSSADRSTTYRRSAAQPMIFPSRSIT